MVFIWWLDANQINSVLSGFSFRTSIVEWQQCACAEELSFALCRRCVHRCRAARHRHRHMIQDWMIALFPVLQSCIIAWTTSGQQRIPVVCLTLRLMIAWKKCKNPKLDPHWLLGSLFSEHGRPTSYQKVYWCIGRNVDNSRVVWNCPLIKRKFPKEI